MKKIVSLAVVTILIGNALFSMEAEKTGELASNLSTLPKELRQYIVSLFLQCHPKYECIKDIKVGTWVTSAAFSPDGKTILPLSLLFDNAHDVCLWDVKTGTEIQRLVGNTRWINSAAFSPDGKTILTGGFDNIARLWDVETGQELKRFTRHTSSLYSVAFSPDGMTVLTGSDDGTALLLDVVSGKALQQFTGHAKAIRSVAFSPDGKTILTVSEDDTARLWDVETGKELQQLDQVSLVKFSPDGKALLVKSSNDGKIRLWNSATGQKIQKYGFWSIGITSAAFSPDGKTILARSVDGVQLWDVGTGKKLTQFTASDSFTSVAFNKDGIMALGNEYGTVSFWQSSYRLPLTLKQKEEAYALFKNKALYAVLRDEPLVIEEQKSFDESSLSSEFEDSYSIGLWAPWSDKALSIGTIGVCAFSLALYMLLKSK